MIEIVASLTSFLADNACHSILSMAKGDDRATEVAGAMKLITSLQYNQFIDPDHCSFQGCIPHLVSYLGPNCPLHDQALAALCNLCGNDHNPPLSNHVAILKLNIWGKLMTSPSRLSFKLISLLANISFRPIHLKKGGIQLFSSKVRLLRQQLKDESIAAYLIGAAMEDAPAEEVESKVKALCAIACWTPDDEIANAFRRRMSFGAALTRIDHEQLASSTKGRNWEEFMVFCRENAGRFDLYEEEESKMRLVTAISNEVFEDLNSGAVRALMALLSCPVAQNAKLVALDALKYLAEGDFGYGTMKNKIDLLQPSDATTLIQLLSCPLSSDEVKIGAAKVLMDMALINPYAQDAFFSYLTALEGDEHDDLGHEKIVKLGAVPPLTSMLLDQSSDMKVRIQAAKTLISLNKLNQDPALVIPVLEAAVVEEGDELSVIGLARMVKGHPSSLLDLLTKDSIILTLKDIHKQKVWQCRDEDRLSSSDGIEELVRDLLSWLGVTVLEPWHENRDKY